MDQLVDYQRELYGRIARSYDNLKKLGSTRLTISLVQSARSALEARWKKFEAQHGQLRTEFGNELRTDEYLTSDLISLVEGTYIEQRVKLLEVEKSLTSSTVSKVRLARSATSAHQVLPRIQLPQFSGKFEDWPAFRDLFRSIVIEEVTLRKVEKMHYLKTGVKRDAEQLIRNLPATEENFDRVWATLTEHFENKRLLVRSYLTAFTSIPRMKAPSAAGLRRIFHGVVSTVGAMEGIGRPITDSTDLFVHLVVELLDAKTRRDWENSLEKLTAPPCYEDLRDFLQEQLMTQEVLQTVGAESPGKAVERSGRSVRNSHVGGQGSEPSRACPLCKKEHLIAYCDLYKKKTAQEKREVINIHLLGDCSSAKICARCSGRHHTTLHEAFTAVALPTARLGGDSPRRQTTAGEQRLDPSRDRSCPDEGPQRCSSYRPRAGRPGFRDLADSGVTGAKTSPATDTDIGCYIRRGRRSDGLFTRSRHRNAGSARRALLARGVVSRAATPLYLQR